MFEFYSQDVRYIVQKCNIEKFKVNLFRLAQNKICKIDRQAETEEMDKILCTRALAENDIEKLIDELHDVLTLACSETFNTQRGSKRKTSNKSVPRWTEELTTMRKRLNTLRRRYQRTRNNEDLRQQRKAQYTEGKARHASTSKKEKFSSWKEYYNLKSSTNPLNEVYILAAGKRKNNTQLSTLRKPFQEFYLLCLLD